MHIRDQTLLSRQLPHIFLVTKTSTKRAHCATKIAYNKWLRISSMVTKINFLLTINNRKKRLESWQNDHLGKTLWSLIKFSYLLLKECIKINMKNCMWILGLGGLREMDPTRYGECKSSDRTKTCCLLRSIQVKFTIAKRLYIVNNPKKT